MSSASILIRFARLAGAPSLTIATYRLATATLVLSIPVFVQGEWRKATQIPRHVIWLILLSGLLLALHFASWITSLDHTSVLSSVVLVTTTPIWIALAAPVFLHERTHKATWKGIVAAIAGGILIGLSDASGNNVITQWGDLLALSGAIFGAFYLIIGRFAQRSVSLLLYLWMVYGVAGFLLAVWCIVAGSPLAGYSLTALALMVSLGLVPQLIGHSAANYALRHLPASLVGVTTLGEPIGSTIFAVILLNETPFLLQVLGAILILLGIGISIYWQAPALPDGVRESNGS